MPFDSQAIELRGDPLQKFLKFVQLAVEKVPRQPRLLGPERAFIVLLVAVFGLLWTQCVPNEYGCHGFHVMVILHRVACFYGLEIRTGNGFQQENQSNLM